MGSREGKKRKSGKEAKRACATRQTYYRHIYIYILTLTARCFRSPRTSSKLVATFSGWIVGSDLGVTTEMVFSPFSHTVILFICCPCYLFLFHSFGLVGTLASKPSSSNVFLYRYACQKRKEEKTRTISTPFGINTSSCLSKTKNYSCTLVGGRKGFSQIF